MSPGVKGTYCKSCHVYFQLRKQADGSFAGRCPRCGRNSYAEPGDDKKLFVSVRSPKTQEKPINIWESFSGGKIIGQVEAGTPARMLETRKYNGVTWYRIVAGNITGWVSGSFIRQISKR